jgi:hypothetical protein
MTTYIRFTEITNIESMERLPNSKNGNPRFQITFANGLKGKTPVDAGWAYAICNGMGEVVVSYHYTPSGRTVLDGLQETAYSRRHRFT